VLLLRAVRALTATQAVLALTQIGVELVHVRLHALALAQLIVVVVVNVVVVVVNVDVVVVVVVEVVVIVGHQARFFVGFESQFLMFFDLAPSLQFVFEYLNLNLNEFDF